MMVMGIMYLDGLKEHLPETLFGNEESSEELDEDSYMVSDTEIDPHNDSETTVEEDSDNNSMVDCDDENHSDDQPWSDDGESDSDDEM